MKLLRLSGLLVLLMMATLSGISASFGAADEFDAAFSRWRATVEAAQAYVDSNGEGDDTVNYKANVQAMIDEARTLQASEQTALDPLKAEMEQLGPQPAADGPKEPKKISQYRATVAAQIDLHETRIKQCSLAILKGSDILVALARTERLKLQTLILAPFPPPVTLGVWQQAFIDLGDVAGSLQQMAADKLSELEANAVLLHRISLTATALLFIGIVGGWQARRQIRRHFGRDMQEPSPSSSRRILAALAGGISNAFVPALLIIGGVVFLHFQDILSDLATSMLWSLAIIAASLFIVIGLTYAAFSPRAPAWRIVPVTPLGARRLPPRIALLSVTLVVTSNIQIVMRTFDLTTGALGSVFLFMQSLIISIILLSMLSARYWNEEKAAAPQENRPENKPAKDAAKDEDEDYGVFIRLARLILTAVAILPPIIALCGYGRLAEFIQTRIILGFVFVGLALLIRMAAQEGGRIFLARQNLGRRAQVGQTVAVASGVMPLLLDFLIDLAVFLPLIPLLLLLFGVPAGTLAIWGGNIASGLTIGGVTISFTGIFLATLTFIVGFAFTGWVQRWLTTRILPSTTLDPSIRNSISSGASYIGVSVSVLCAVSVLGVGFANLAIVAGALSVGIGFGLKAIVENFVAGLLILIERPIRVGDWIIVGGNEGTVRHISVRATEIETFDRASVIIPNSEIIASSVTNWTHKNRIARLIIKVGVDYGTDTRLVSSLLVECAKAQEEILKYPEPKAFFVSFGDYSLNFELRCFVRDTDFMLSTKSNLHFAINDIFQENHINIPSPQREVRIVAVSGTPAEMKQATGDDVIDRPLRG